MSKVTGSRGSWTQRRGGGNRKQQSDVDGEEKEATRWVKGAACRVGSGGTSGTDGLHGLNGCFLCPGARNARVPLGQLSPGGFSAVCGLAWVAEEMLCALPAQDEGPEKEWER